MKFSLRTLLYVVTLLGASLAAFGGGGILGATAVVAVRGLWRPVVEWCEASRGWVVTGMVGGGLVFLFWPAVYVNPSRPLAEASRRMHEISIALTRHPPSQRTKPDTPLASWRTHMWNDDGILDWISPTSQPYDFTKSWSDPANKGWLVANPFRVHLTPVLPPNDEINIYAVGDERTVWTAPDGPDFTRLKDDPSTTLLLLQASGRGIKVSEPRDLTFEDAVETLSGPIRPQIGDGYLLEGGYFTRPQPTRLIATCDGDVHRLYRPLPRDVAAALLTADGDEAIDLSLYTTSAQSLHCDHIVALGMFLALTVMPSRWLSPPEREEEATP